VFFEVEAEPAGGEAAVALRLLPRDRAVSSSASASTRLSRSSARRKITGMPLRGRPLLLSGAGRRG
jgi:hypothetical protein